MKIIILAFCLIAAGRVQAQQKELFSIEEHLKKNKPGVISQPAPLALNSSIHPKIETGQEKPAL